MGAVVELLAEGGLGLALLAGVCAWLAATGLLWLWARTIGAGVLYIAKFFPGRVRVLGKTILPDIGASLRAANNAVYGYFQVWKEGAETEIAWSIKTMRLIWQANAEALDWLARETDKSFDWLQHIHLPKVVKPLTAALLWPLLLPRIAKYIAEHVKGATTVIYRTITKEIPAKVIHPAVKAATVALPGALGLPAIRKEIVGLTKRNLWINKRLHRVEALFGTVAMAAAMANVLGLPNWRCLTRGNVGKVSRALCGLGSGALNDLLGLLADVLILQNICTVITLMEDGLSLIAEPLTSWLDGAAAMFVHCNYDLVAADPLDLPYLPPVTGVALYTP